MDPFSAEDVAAADGPLLQVQLDGEGLPRAAIATALFAAAPARVWALVSDIDGYVGRVPMMDRIRLDGDRVTVGLRFKLPLFSVGFQFVAVRSAERLVFHELRGVSGEPKNLRLRFDLEPLGNGEKTLVRSTAELDARSLGWLAKYFLGHHPEIQHGILPGVALALLDSMRRAL